MRSAGALFFFIAVAALFTGCAEEVEEPVGEPPPPPPPITVSITTPQAGALVGGGLLHVTGEVSGSAATVIQLNGVGVPAEGGHFSYFLPVEDGPLTITATEPDSSASDSVDVTVDAMPPVLAIDGPARGTVVATGSGVVMFVTASDETGLTRLEAAGQPLDPKAGPKWTVDVALVDGLNTLRVEAEDAAGNLSQEHVNVLSGHFEPPDVAMKEAVIIHMGAGALSGVTDLIGELTDTFDFLTVALASNPVVASDVADVHVTAFSLQPGTVVSVVPTKDRLEIGLTIKGLKLGGKIILGALGGTTFDITLDVATLTVLAPVGITAADGEFVVTLLEPTFDFEEPAISVKTEDGQGADSTAAIEGAALESIEELLTASALTQGAQVLQLVVAKLYEPFLLEVQGAEITLDLEAIAAEVDDHGVELRLSGVVAIDGESVVADDPGVLRPLNDTSPFVPRGPQVTVALSDDLANTVLHGIWRLGLLEFDVDQQTMDDLNAHLELVAGFLGGLTDMIGDGVDPETPMTVNLRALLPPILSDVPESDAVGIALGDGEIRFQTSKSWLVTGHLTLRMAAGALSADHDLTLDLFPFNTAFDLSSIDKTIKRQTEGTVEAFVSSFLEEIAPLLKQIVGNIGVPVFQGFTLEKLSVGDDATDGRYLVVRGSLHRVEAEASE